MSGMILKWLGGKRRIVAAIKEILPKNLELRGYHEPFLGGGAVLFSVKPNRGTANDVNPRLINFYRVVRDYPRELIDEAKRFRYDKEIYYLLRDKFNTESLSPVEDAGIFLYLNKTGYNGLYRVNSSGLFNVPFGRYKNPNIVSEAKILEASRVLRKVDLRCEDFSYVIDEAKEGDIVYMDPPYKPLSKTSNFTSYYIEGFNESEQIRLRDICIELDKKRVLFIISNSEPAAELYKGFKIMKVHANRAINSKSMLRGPIKEILVTNIQI
jgi:DNA adenine methylase